MLRHLLALTHAEKAADTENNSRTLPSLVRTISFTLPTVSFAAFTTVVPMSLLARIASAWCEYHSFCAPVVLSTEVSVVLAVGGSVGFAAGGASGVGAGAGLVWAKTREDPANNRPVVKPSSVVLILLLLGDLVKTVLYPNVPAMVQFPMP